MRRIFGNTGQVTYPNTATQPTVAQPRGRTRGLWWKILLGIVAILLVLALLAELGLRWFIKDNLEGALKDQAAASKVQMREDPTVALGSSSVLLGLMQGKIPQLDMTIPSSLQISYEDNDKSRPVVAGNPAVTMHATDIRVEGKDRDNMVMGTLDVETVMPTAAMLAQAQQTMSESAQQDGSGQDGSGQDALTGMLGELLKVTDITADEQDQTLVFQLGGGIADLVLKPTVRDGQLHMDAADVKFLGFSLPEGIVNTLGEQLAKQAAEAGDKMGNMEMKEATITKDGLRVVMQGHDVNMADMARTVEESGGTIRGGSGQGGAGQSGSGQDGTGQGGAGRGGAGSLDQHSGGTGDNSGGSLTPEGVYGSSGDAYGS